MTQHVLKTLSLYLGAIGRGEKTFEVRRNDRNFQVGDELLLREWCGSVDGAGEYGPRWLSCRVSYVFHGGVYGIEPGHVVLGIKLPDNHTWPESNAPPLPGDFPSLERIADALCRLLARAHDTFPVRCTGCGVRPCLCKSNRDAMRAADDVLVEYVSAKQRQDSERTFCPDWLTKAEGGGR